MILLRDRTLKEATHRLTAVGDDHFNVLHLHDKLVSTLSSSSSSSSWPAPSTWSTTWSSPSTWPSSPQVHPQASSSSTSSRYQYYHLQGGHHSTWPSSPQVQPEASSPLGCMSDPVDGKSGGITCKKITMTIIVTSISLSLYIFDLIIVKVPPRSWVKSPVPLPPQGPRCRCPCSHWCCPARSWG